MSVNRIASHVMRTKAQQNKDYYKCRRVMESYYNQYGTLPVVPPPPEKSAARKIFGDYMVDMYHWYLGDYRDSKLAEDDE